MTARVEDQIVDCFHHGGGVPYTAYAGFAEAMHETSAPMLDACLLDVILPMAPGVTPALERGIDVLEVGCGTGHALNLMAGRFSASRFLGYDLVEENIARARATAGERRLENVTFEVKDVAGMGHAGRFAIAGKAKCVAKGFGHGGAGWGRAWPLLFRGGVGVGARGKALPRRENPPLDPLP